MSHECMFCKEEDMVFETKDITITFKHLSTEVLSVTGWHCPHCGEIEFTDEESSRRHMDALQNLIDKI